MHIERDTADTPESDVKFHSLPTFSYFQFKEGLIWEHAPERLYKTDNETENILRDFENGALKTLMGKIEGEGKGGVRMDG